MEHKQHKPGVQAVVLLQSPIQTLLYLIQRGNPIFLSEALGTQAAVNEQTRSLFMCGGGRTALRGLFPEQLEDHQLYRIRKESGMKALRPQRPIEALQISGAAKNPEETDHVRFPSRVSRCTAREPLPAHPIGKRKVSAEQRICHDPEGEPHPRRCPRPLVGRRPPRLRAQRLLRRDPAPSGPAVASPAERAGSGGKPRAPGALGWSFPYPDVSGRLARPRGPLA